MTRDEAIENLEQLWSEVYNEDSDGYDYAKAIDMAIETLKSKYGEWQVYYDEDSPQDGIWKCSICSYIRLIDDISPTNFCPNCGADMKGEDNGN